MNRLRVGLIGGTKGFGLRRTKAFHANPRTEVVAICARTPAEVKKAAREFGAKPYTAWVDLIADPKVDAVSVAMPNTMHFEAARTALSAHKHTLVEYPICQTLQEFSELTTIARLNGVVLHHALTVRGEPLHLKLKELVPRLGRLCHAHYRYFGAGGWYLDPARRGDALLALHIHFLDQFEDIMGKTIRVNATLKVIHDGNVNIHTGTTLQEFADGANAFQEFGMGFGAKPSYTGWYLGENGWLSFEKGSTIRRVLADGADETFSPDDINVVVNDTENFVAQVFDGAPSWVPESQTRRTMRLCLAASESARIGEKFVLR